MSDTVIKVENVSKLYHLGEVGTGTLRHDLNRAWHKFLGKEDPYLKVGETNDRTKKGGSYAWALKDICFEVKRGEVLGIIGRNGAGKSTLLKILSRVTAPTSGQIKVKGRIASLLEVGTGFHPELTGRDNIYLNGAILGMRKREIESKLEEIVAFAEVERYIDTPVKRYSSGMYVRLAFAVAAHLEPEILIVDEVLAVGDAEFQRKCLGKMQDVSTKEGRTILFVSHNTLAIQRLCNAAILLESGTCVASGSVNKILDLHSTSAECTAHYENQHSAGKNTIVAARILTKKPTTDRELQVLVEWYLKESTPDIKIGIGFNSSDGQRIFGTTPSDQGVSTPGTRGLHRAVFTVPSNVFLSRTYTIALALWDKRETYDYPNPALRFSVEAAPSGPYSDQNYREGLVNVTGQWSIYDNI